MKTETEIRDMIEKLEVFAKRGKPNPYMSRDEALLKIGALKWVLSPPQDKEEKI